jgi:hypothetical protein
MATKSFRSALDDDDNPFDSNGLLKDGRRLRVPTMLMDANSLNQRAVMLDAALHRPGFRTIVEDASGSVHDASAAAHRRRLQDVSKAKAEYLDYITNAWKGEDAAFSDDEDYGPQTVGQVCTVAAEDYPEQYGSPGHVRRVGGRYLCVPDRPNQSAPASDGRTVKQLMQDKERIMQVAYDAYDAQLRDAYREG